MNLKFDWLPEKVAVECRHSRKHFKMNLEVPMEEMVAMVPMLFFKVIGHFGEDRMRLKIEIVQTNPK